MFLVVFSFSIRSTSIVDLKLRDDVGDAERIETASGHGHGCVGVGVSISLIYNPPSTLSSILAAAKQVFILVSTVLRQYGYLGERICIIFRTCFSYSSSREVFLEKYAKLDWK
jgi:hypothetical protein